MSTTLIQMKTLKGIDLFAGAGGMSLGAMKAGITISHAVEVDVSSSTTYKRNHPSAEIFQKDIVDIGGKDFPYDNPFVLFGGPPCQGFSSSNRRTRNTRNEKNSLFHEFLRITKLLTPDWIVFENVEGIVSFNNGSIIGELETIISDFGYISSKSVLDASDFGVPQERKRFFLVANRRGIDFMFPSPQKSKVNVIDAIGDLPTLKNGDFIEELPYNSSRKSSFAKKMRKGMTVSRQNYVSKNRNYVLERYKHIREGENWQAIPKNLMQNYSDRSRCHSGIYRRLSNDKPSVVISNYRKNMLIHPNQDRGLSVREAARLQSFPDNYVFYGQLNSIQQQIGNAVPPLLAEAIFRRIIEMSYE